jgi:hypothetical protein
MSVIAPADADALTLEDEAELADDTAAIQRGIANIRTAAVDMGDRLAKQYTRLPVGKFLRWVETKCGITGQTARNLMNLAKLARSKPVLIDLPIDLSALYVAAAPSTSEKAVDEIIAIAQDNKVNKEMAREIAQKNRGEPPRRGRKPRAAFDTPDPLPDTPSDTPTTPKKDELAPNTSREPQHRQNSVLTPTPLETILKETAKIKEKVSKIAQRQICSEVTRSANTIEKKANELAASAEVHAAAE